MSKKSEYNSLEFLNDIIYGDIESPKIPERNTLTKLSDTSDKQKRAQFILLVEVTEFILLHLERWIKERLTPDLRFWYIECSAFETPFTTRLMAIEKCCEGVLNVLPARLPDFQQRFGEMYERLIQSASEADSTRFENLKDSINIFKAASKNFCGIVRMIHSEALAIIKSNTVAQENIPQKKHKGRPPVNVQPILEFIDNSKNYAELCKNKRRIWAFLAKKFNYSSNSKAPNRALQSLFSQTYPKYYQSIQRLK